MLGLLKSDIPLELQDNTVRSPLWTYWLCMAIRITLGLVLLVSKNHLAHQIITVALILPFLGLGYKLIKLGLRLWKNYIRHSVLHGIAIVLLLAAFYKHSDWLVKPAGLLLIIDAMMGWQSRFIMSNAWYVMQKRLGK